MKKGNLFQDYLKSCPVRAIGVEPTCLTALDPKSSASANFATPAKMERKGIFFWEKSKAVIAQKPT